jgi:ABC-type transporter Mla subunit MlaD
MRFYNLPLLLIYALVFACVGSFKLTVFYDHTQDLKTNDRVMWQEQTIGKVQSVTRNPQDRFAVELRIKRDFSQMATDQSRFLIRADPQRQGQQSVQMIQLTEGGKPLPDGAEVEGSTQLSLQFERGARGLKTWSELLQQELERWQKELNELPETDWYKDLERQMDYWVQELEQTGQETRRYFREEVLPRLEEAVRELQRRLRELGKRKDAEILEIKLEQLRQISSSRL